MSRDNLVSKQTIKAHIFLINEERYDLVITSHKQKKGYNGSKNKQKRQ